MRTRIISAILLAAAVGGVVACRPTDGSKTTGTPAPGVTTSASKDDKPAAAGHKTVPNFVGMGLQSAQDAAQEQGFYSLKSHDSLGRDRMQILDRDWKVCSQNVKGGTSQATDTTINFGAVKLAEKCPAKDEAAPSAAGGTMPDFKGKSVKAARAALDPSTSITVKDASASDRLVLIESNWKVCTQSPSAGTALRGQPVAFTAVKFEESC
ncbi:PASTA domain-containing protein [Streptomyces sp. S1D4-11]